MKDRDCESCKKFSRVDPLESEGYCDAKRTWVDPQEGEDCKMHEFTLHSATKYKDGTPIMTEPERVYCETDSTPIHGQSNQLDSLEQRVDELSEEYDAVLKTHGDTLEQHKERITNNEENISDLCSDVEELLDRICELEHMYESILDGICAMRGRLCGATDLLVGQDKFSHIFSNFCGDCLHAIMKDGICTCNLSGEIVDPDSASCSMFEPPF